MPIINEYRNTNVGQEYMNEMVCPQGSMAQAYHQPAIVNMGGNAVTGYSIRYTSIDEVNAQSGMPAEMAMAQEFFRQGPGGAPGSSWANPQMYP
ncbi:MAG: hypothetical protein FWD25_01390 [Clostridia bacterium]|nr:hypothetical protein [Clostridia bacterium]